MYFIKVCFEQYGLFRNKNRKNYRLKIKTRAAMIARRGVIKYSKYYRHAGDKRPDIIITRYTVMNLIVVACLGWLVS